MSTLKGQNFRIYLDQAGYAVIAKSSSCTVTLTGNSEEASTKDDVDLASKPEITSKSWSVSVESLDVVNVSAFLTAIKSQNSFYLMWDEAATTDNQTPEGAAFARKGTAYLNDVTFNFNDRENSTKSLQFTGSGPLTKLQSAEQITTVPVDDAFTKGQNVRLYLGSDNSAVPAKVIASAKQLSLHVSLSLEDSTTKDTDGDWQVQEPTGLSYDISVNALVRGNDTITSNVDAQDLANVQDIYETATPVKWQIANVSGPNHRTKGSVIASGSVVITSLTINAPNRQTVTYEAQLQGYGAYTVGA